MKKILSLCLALVLCVGLAVPAMAAGTTETIEGERVTFTISNVVRKVTDTYLSFGMPEELTIYVVGDEGSTLTITPKVAGKEVDFSYGLTRWDTEEGFMNGVGDFIYIDAPYVLSFPDASGFSGPVLYRYRDDIGVAIMIESEFAAITPVGAEPTPEQPETPTEQPETPTQPVAPPPTPGTTGSYTVKAGDTLGQIALNYYGSYAHHPALYQANIEAFRASSGGLDVGMVLTLPEKLGDATRLPDQVLAEGETFYTVKAGDCLSLIALAHYGDMMKYQAIYERNADRLKDANTIFEGQILILPAK